MGEGTPSSLSIAKLGLEGAYGAGTATLVVPFTAAGLAGLFDPVLDQGLRGIAAKDFGSYKGPARAEGSLEGYAFKPVIDMLVASIIGSGGILSSSPSTLGFTLADGTGAINGRGLGVTELTIRFNRAEGAVTYSASFLGQKVVPTGPIGTSHDVAKPPMGWKAVSSLAGVSGEVIEGEFSLSREWALFYGGSGVDAAYASNAYAGPLEATGRFTVDFSLLADLDVVLNKTQGAVSVTVADEDGANGFTLDAPLADFGDGLFELDRSGVYVTLALSCRFLYDESTGQGPISIS